MFMSSEWWSYAGYLLLPALVNNSTIITIVKTKIITIIINITLNHTT